MSRIRARILVVVVAAGVALVMATAASTSSGQDQAPPEGGERSARQTVDPNRPPRCFGAASRDPERRCVNKDLFLTVVPTPEQARSGQNSPCTPADQTAELYPCLFGPPPDQAVRTIALVGDSHAGHWRAALDVVARQRRWHGISLTQTGCPMTKAIPILKGRQRDDCLEYNEAIGPWLERHPEVTMVFTSQHGGRVVTARGQSQYDAQLEGFMRAFEELPPSVEHMIVIRGTPWSTKRAPTCIEEAIADGKRPDLECAIPRKRSLRQDLAAEAATIMRSPRVKVLDLTPFMCGRKECFPVVGGALVHKDGGHITQVFSRTLGPYLGRYVDRIMPPES
ncbi:MAG TPA: SGNH hydrolase domain-containing protein [Solirubrobacteraceae bacterium]|nr:SGNH hydrolase domain-containing protein [Solirubrobacteraceae bacterium]